MRGRDLRQLRKDAKITQSDLRAYLRWDVWKIVKIENEEVLPTPDDEAAYIEAVRILGAQKAAVA